MEETKLELDSAFHLSMEERIVKDEVRRPQTAALRAVRLTAIGLLTGPGAAVVKLAAEEHSSDGGLASNQNMEGDLAGESLETREFATFITANTC